MHLRHKLSLAVMIFFVVLTADIASKNWARNNLEPGHSYPFIPYLVNLTITSNTGGAFGVGKDMGFAVTLLAVCVLVGVVCWIAKRERAGSPPKPLEWAALGFLFGGAIGNLLDRFTAGRVLDFLEFAFIDFPIFNVADISIDVALALILFSHFKHSDPQAIRGAGETSSS